MNGGQTARRTLSGSNAPDVAGAPFKVGSIAAASLPAGTTPYQFTLDMKLSPNAKRRLFTLANNMDQNLGTVQAAVFDKATLTAAGLLDSGFSNTGANVLQTLTASLNKQTWCMWGLYPETTGTNQTNGLQDPGDSLLLIVNTSATPPSTGALDIWCREIL